MRHSRVELPPAEDVGDYRHEYGWANGCVVMFKIKKPAFVSVKVATNTIPPTAFYDLKWISPTGSDKQKARYVLCKLESREIPCLAPCVPPAWAAQLDSGDIFLVPETARTEAKMWLFTKNVGWADITSQWNGDIHSSDRVEHPKYRSALYLTRRAGSKQGDPDWPNWIQESTLKKKA
ncbi:hypothetical protein ONZ45_g8600 [Pleurotus djamor]|nr:hypothetical protein ONZ45_g8600 [Pleurotus djamor]